MIKFSKKILALVLSLLMMFSFMAVSASAEGEGTEPAETVTIQIPSPVCTFDQKTMTITVAKAENIAYGEGEDKYYYPVEFTAADDEAIALVPNADGSFVIENVELGTEYTITATLNDTKDDDVTVAGTASTKVVPAITVPGTKDICTFNEENRNIIVEKIDNIIVGGAELTVGISIEPEASSQVLGDGTTMFLNLDYATKYTVKAYVTPSADSETYFSEDNFEVTIKGQQEAPKVPVPTAITANSITIDASTGCEYTIDTTPAQTKKSEGNAAIVFEGLEPGKKYTITAQKPAIEGYYASEKVTISVTTKLAGISEIPAIALEDKTNTSITVTAVENAEYKLNDGAWQNSNVFTGLKAGTQYNIYARFKFDAAKQDPSAVSEALVVKTNAVENYEADAKKVSFSANNGAYANTEISFTVSGDGPADMNKAVYGDTRIIPVAYEVVYGEETIKEFSLFSGQKVAQSGSFIPSDAYAEKTVKVIVTFSKEEFKGADWVYADEQFDKEFTVTVGRVDGPMTKVIEFFEMIANFLLNTVPAFITQAMQSDVWGALFEALGKLGGVMG